MADIPDTGEKLLLQIIDKVFAIVTAAPTADGDLKPDKQGSNRLRSDSTVVQLSMPGIPLYPEDFKDMFHPSNTGGKKDKTALFSWLVDAIPSTGSLKYEQTPRRVSSAYRAIVAGASALVPPISPALQHQLDAHNAVLHKASGAKTRDFEEYIKRQDELGQAQDTLRHVAKVAADKADEYDVDHPDFDKKIAAEKARIVALYKRKAQDYFDEAYPQARRAVLRALDELNDARISRVEDALTFIRTNGKELSGQLLKAMKDQFDVEDPYYRDAKLNVPVLLSYPSHTAFANPGSTSGWMSISCNSESLDLSQSVTASRSGGAAGGFWSLFFFKGGAGHTEETEKIDVTSSSIQIRFELAIVNILRPWMDATLFSESIVWCAGRDQKAGSVSSGRFETQNDSHLLSLVPMQMLVARNIEIVGAFDDRHQTFVKNHTDAGGSFGWGPFSFGASHSQNSANFTKKGDGSGVTLRLEGIQCIGFVSWIPPRCAPRDGTADAEPLVLPTEAERQQQQAMAKRAVAILATPPKSRAAGS
jgi:hypothetical protein